MVLSLGFGVKWDWQFDYVIVNLFGFDFCIWELRMTLHNMWTDTGNVIIHSSPQLMTLQKYSNVICNFKWWGEECIIRLPMSYAIFVTMSLLIRDCQCCCDNVFVNITRMVCGNLVWRNEHCCFLSIVADNLCIFTILFSTISTLTVSYCPLHNLISDNLVFWQSWSTDNLEAWVLNL